jgi:SH3-like domain-containing protein
MRKTLTFVTLVALALVVQAQGAAKPQKGAGGNAASAKAEPIKNGVIVKSPQASLLSKPGKGASRLEVLGKFTPVKTIDKSAAGYVQVETLAGKKGYVAAKDLAENAFVSVDSKKPINIRSGPGANDIILFTLQNTYPLAVVEKKGSRIKVVDYEGDTGWVHEGLLSTKPYAIVSLKSINLRKSGDLDSSGKPTGDVAFTAPRGVVFEILGTDPKSGWIHVRHADGDEAWCSPKVVWGWANE